MKYSEKALATIKGKKFIIGMVTAGIMAAGLAAPSSASATTLPVIGNAGSSTTGNNAIGLGTMASAGLQGSAWSTQNFSSGMSNSASNTMATKGAVEGKGAGELQLRTTSTNDGSATVPSTKSAALDGGVQASGSTTTSTDTASGAASSSNAGSGALGLQGGAGLTLNLSTGSTTEGSRDSLLGL